MERGWPAVVRAYEQVVDHLDRPAGEVIDGVRSARRELRQALGQNPPPRPTTSAEARRARRATT